MATKKLKELLEARKSSNRDTSGMTCLVDNNSFVFFKLRRQKVLILVIGVPYCTWENRVIVLYRGVIFLKRFKL
jgi:hypothetical protein